MKDLKNLNIRNVALATNWNIRLSWRTNIIYIKKYKNTKITKT